jgi:hypothetical protein
VTFLIILVARLNDEDLRALILIRMAGEFIRFKPLKSKFEEENSKLVNIKCPRLVEDECSGNALLNDLRSTCQCSGFLSEWLLEEQCLFADMRSSDSPAELCRRW